MLLSKVALFTTSGQNRVSGPSKDAPRFGVHEANILGHRFRDFSNHFVGEHAIVQFRSHIEHARCMRQREKPIAAKMEAFLGRCLAYGDDGTLRYVLIGFQTSDGLLGGCVYLHSRITQAQVDQNGVVRVIHCVFHFGRVRRRSVQKQSLHILHWSMKVFIRFAKVLSRHVFELTPVLCYTFRFV
jgi:hypothetical protein